MSFVVEDLHKAAKIFLEQGDVAYYLDTNLKTIVGQASCLSK